MDSCAGAVLPDSATHILSLRRAEGVAMSDRKSRRLSAGLILIVIGLGLYAIDSMEGIGEGAVC